MREKERDREARKGEKTYQRKRDEGVEKKQAEVHAQKIQRTPHGTGEEEDEEEEIEEHRTREKEREGKTKRR